MCLIRVLKSLWKLDPFDMCYALSSEDISIFNDLPREAIPPKSVVRSIARYVYRVIFNKYACSSSKRGVLNSVWIYCDSTNGLNAVNFLREKLSESYITSGDMPGEKVLTRSGLALALLYLPNLMYIYFRCSRLRRRVMSHYFDDYLRAYAVYISGFTMIYKHKPKAILFTNDHSCNARAFFMAASNCEVKTIFIQHASFTKKMPPLDFDFALLDGINSLNNYAKKGDCGSKVFFVGLPRVDAQCVDMQIGSGVGICTTLLDDYAVVERVVSECVSTLGAENVVLRYHPSATAERKEEWHRMAFKYGVEISDPKIDSIVNFFSKINKIIAGDCSILLEASIIGINAAMYNFSNEYSDRYDYIKRGLVPLLLKEEVVRWLRGDLGLSSGKDAVISFAQTFGGDWHGCSHILAEKIIKGLIADEGDFMSDCLFHEKDAVWYEYRGS